MTIDAIQYSVEAGKLGHPNFAAFFTHELQGIGDELFSYIDDYIYENITSGWKGENQPTFFYNSNINPSGSFEFTMFTTDEVWNWVSQGTSPHIISPRSDSYTMNFLGFEFPYSGIGSQSGYVAGSLPFSSAFAAGGSRGYFGRVSQYGDFQIRIGSASFRGQPPRPNRRKTYIDHPGIEPRQFESSLRQILFTRFERRLNELLLLSV